jgi:hypothetical protein
MFRGFPACFIVNSKRPARNPVRTVAPSTLEFRNEGRQPLASVLSCFPENFCRLPRVIKKGAVKKPVKKD